MPIPYWNIFHFSDLFILINKTFMSKLFLSGNKFGFAGNIWACLSANITIHNFVIGIINEPQKLWLPDNVEFTHFSFRTRNFITILASYFRRCCIRQASFMVSWRFCFLLIVVTCKLKTFMSESILHFKIPDNQCRNLNWKIRSMRERKCSGNINSPSGYQYTIFTRILQK